MVKFGLEAELQTLFDSKKPDLHWPQVLVALQVKQLAILQLTQVLLSAVKPEVQLVQLPALVGQ